MRRPVYGAKAREALRGIASELRSTKATMKETAAKIKAIPVTAPAKPEPPKPPPTTANPATTDPPMERLLASTLIPTDTAGAEAAYNRALRPLDNIRWRQQTIDWLTHEARTWQQLLERLAGDYWLGIHLHRHGRTPIPPTAWGEIRALAIRTVDDLIGPSGELPDPDELLEAWNCEFPAFEKIIKDAKATPSEKDKDNTTTPDPADHDPTSTEEPEKTEQRGKVRWLLAEFLLNTTRLTEVDERVVEHFLSLKTPPEDALTNTDYRDWLFSQVDPVAEQWAQAIYSYLNSTEGLAYLASKKFRLLRTNESAFGLKAQGMVFTAYGYPVNEKVEERTQAAIERGTLAPCFESL